MNKLIGLLVIVVMGLLVVGLGNTASYLCLIGAIFALFFAACFSLEEAEYRKIHVEEDFPTAPAHYDSYVI